jgi:hypothetical protein
VKYSLLFLLLSLSGFADNAMYAQKQSLDTQWHFTMQPVEITAAREWANDTVQYKYNQMKYYITTVLPYVHAATALHNELALKTGQEDIKRKERRQFVNMREQQLKEQYGAEVKELNVTQGALMIKLIARQTGANLYDMLKEYKGQVFAAKWLAWSKLNGFSIGRKYNPDDNIMMENIMEDLGYPLPSFYKERVILTAN